MRATILTLTAALALAACGSKSEQANTDMNADMNAGMTDMNATDPNMMMADQNATGGADMNMATNSATENQMKAEDMNTNDKDANLANGM